MAEAQAPNAPQSVNPAPVTIAGVRQPGVPSSLGGQVVQVGSGSGALATALGLPTGKTGSTPCLNADGSHKGNTYVCATGATYQGRVTLPPTTGSGWTRITSAGTLPAGVRAGPSGAQMYKIVSNGAGNDPALDIPFGSNGWHLIGAELTHSAITLQQEGVGRLDGARIVLDRCYIHGVSETADLMVRGLLIHGADVQVWNSWLSEWQWTQNDSQAIWCTNNQRLHIENNEIQGAGENIMLCDQGSASPSEHVTIMRNHLFKPLRWRKNLGNGTANPSWDGIVGNGTGWFIKELLEIKWGRNVLVYGNDMENNWGGQGQDGTACLISGGNVLANPSADIHFLSNIIRNAPQMFGVQTYVGTGPTPVRIKFENNLGLQVSNFMVLFNHQSQDVCVEHNTAVPQNGSDFASSGARDALIWTDIVDGQLVTPSWPRQTIRRNVLGKSANGLFFDGHQNMTTASADQFIPDRDWRENAVYNASGQPAVTGFTFYPTAAAAGVNTATGQLTAGSPLILGGTDNKDLGTDHVALASAQTGDAPPDVDTTPGTVPSALDDGTPLATSFTLSFTGSTDAESGITGYEIEVTDAVTTAIENFSVTASPLTITGRVSARNYSSRVRSVNGAGLRSAYSSPLVTTMAAAPTSTPLPPDLMRGFGPTRGVGATDKIVLPLTAHATSRSWAAWVTRNNAVGANNRVFDKHDFSEALYFAEGGTPLYVFARQFSTTTGVWSFPAPAQGVRSCIIIKHNGASVGNVPMVKVDDVVQTVTTIIAPVGTVSTNANPYVLGNRSTPDDRGWDGDIAKFTVYDFLTSDANDVDFIEGDDPEAIGAGATAYHPLAGEASEPDSVTAGTSTITGTQVQSYAAAPTTTIDTLLVDSGDPTLGTAYSVLASTTGTVNRVEFWVDGVLLRTDSSAPYTLFATTGTLGPGLHTVEARAFAGAGGTPADVQTLSFTEGTPATSDTTRVTYTWPRDPNAVGGYNSYIEDVLRALVPQPPVGSDPTYAAVFPGNDVTSKFSVSCIYAGGVESAKLSLRVRKKAAVTTGAKPPTGIQEISSIYIP